MIHGDGASPVRYGFGEGSAPQLNTHGWNH